ncbi:MAG: hypothetical protein V1859_08160 [archaeon]
MKKIMYLAILAALVIALGCSQQALENTANKQGMPENALPENSQRVQERDINAAPAQETEIDASTTDAITDVSDEEPVKTTVTSLDFDDAADDCTLLTPDDIKKVCGAETAEENQEANINLGQVCIRMFKSNDPLKSMKIHYTGDNSRGGLAPEVIAKQSCDGMKAEMINDHSCFAETAGKSVFVYGKKRIVVIANAMPMEQYLLCSREQLKELGKLVSERLYS